MLEINEKMFPFPELQIWLVFSYNENSFYFFFC